MTVILLLRKEVDILSTDLTCNPKAGGSELFKFKSTVANRRV